MSTSNSDEHTAATEEVDDIVIDRSCISCDNCGVGSPQKCCGRCGSYSIVECQVQDWKQHKSICKAFKEQHDMWNEDKSNVLPDSSVLDTKEGPCAICLEETIAKPVSLPCGHEFCFECIGEYQHSGSSNPSSCPYCRGEIPDVVRNSLERHQIYVSRALQSPKGSEEQKKYARLAMAEYDTAEKICKTDDDDIIQGMFMRSILVAMTDQPEETIKIANKTLSLNEKQPGSLTFDQVMQVKNAQAEAYSELRKWKDAVKIYTSIYKEYKRRNKVPHGNIFVGKCRALYMRKEYDKAIKFGTIGTQFCRSSPRIHKYMALSQKALGNIDEAKITLKRAILYEKQWDKDNLEKNKQLLRELNNH